MTVFSSLHPFTIGYDDVFKHFETLLELRIDRQSAHALIRIANAKKNWTKPSKHISICGRNGEIGIDSN